jgi:ParB/RepB/Spo0J family partition protein
MTETLTPGYHELPLTMLVPSSMNPRKTLGDVTDLAASIREVGILEPILVRPRERRDTPETGEASYEVVAGSRRHAAAQAAGLLMVPCLVRELTDAQALELAIVENNQRGDIHPLDEAEAFVSLAGMNRLYTPDVIAAKIGRPKAYVTGRLRLLQLVPAVREAFAADRITIGHAERIARLKPEVQERALRACYLELFHDEDEGPDPSFELRGIARLDAWIREHVVIDLADPLVQEALPELAETVARVERAGGTVLRLSDDYYVELDDAAGPAPLPRSKWVEILADPCAHAQPGVIVYGSSKQPTMLSVCAKDSACPTHWPAPVKAAKGKKPTKSAWEKEEERRAEDRKVFEAQEADLFADITRHLADHPVNMALFRLLVSEHRVPRIEALLGAPVNDANVAHALWLAGVSSLSTWNIAEFSVDVQDATGFDVAAWRAAHAPAPEPTAKKAAKRQKASK